MPYKPFTPHSRVIRDIRDARLDYWLPTEQAIALFNDGRLEKYAEGGAYAGSYIEPDKSGL